jgi:aryl-alcohol dehydrogenase-like predicted oxidoreductase
MGIPSAASSHHSRTLLHLIGRLTMPLGEVSAMTTASATQPRQLGRTGPAVFPIALGCMGMSGMYGPADEPESLATIHAAIDAGVTLIDTGDFYGMGHNEMLLSRALRFFREKVLISVKFGAQRGPDGAWLGYDARPAAVKTALAYSLKRLGVDYIDIYRPARLDPNVPIEDTVGAIADMIKAGYVRHIGLSEVGPETVRRAAAVHPIVDLQIEYSLISRSPEAKIFPALEELGIAVTAYGVLSRGLLSGSAISGAGDIRNRFPRFAAANQPQNQKLVARLAEIAAGKGITQSQLALAWVLAKSPSIIPVIGARTRAQLSESLAALNVTLTAEEVAAIEAVVPANAVAGTRYEAHQMHALDSEK